MHADCWWKDFFCLFSSALSTFLLVLFSSALSSFKQLNALYSMFEWMKTEVESSRTSLASRTSSRTDFEVLGLGLEGQVLGLEVSSPRKLTCPRLENSTIFWIVKIFGKRFFVEIAWKIFVKTFFFFLEIAWKIFVKTFYFFFFLRALALVSLALASSIPVLGLESVCPRKGSERLGKSLASRVSDL